LGPIDAALAMGQLSDPVGFGGMGGGKDFVKARLSAGRKTRTIHLTI
jgi:hypothetical protein